MFFQRKKAHMASTDGGDEQRRVALDRFARFAAEDAARDASRRDVLDRLARLAAHDAGRDVRPADTRPGPDDEALRAALGAEIANAVDRLGGAPSSG